MANEVDYKDLFYSLIADITLADHIGDVCNSIEVALIDARDEVEWIDLQELGRKLGERGITTLYGVKLTDEEEL